MKYSLALTLIDGLGPAKQKKLLSFYETAEEIYKVSKDELIKEANLSPEIASQIVSDNFNEANEILDWCNEFSIEIITPNHILYPPLLKEIFDPPQLLYVMGNLDALKLPAVGIVGMRKPDGYGREVCFDFASSIASAGCCVVSGLAFGIDKIAHEAALSVGGTTVAVLGTGLDMIYPSAHRSMAVDITKDGALISEYAPRHGAMPYRFIQRNRIISGLSKATVVIEAAKKSGSLATADFALNQGRELFAVPGSIYSPCCEGTNHLITEGAEPLVNCEQIFEVMNISKNEVEDASEQLSLFENNSVKNLSEDEKKLIDILETSGAKRIDQLMEETSFEENTLFELLLNLELENIIEQDVGQRFKVR